MSDRFDDLLIKARAEMLGKHTLRPEPQTDVVFEYVWDQMQKGFKDGLKQTAMPIIAIKKKAVLHNQNHFKMLATEQPSEGNKEIKKPKSEGKRKRPNQWLKPENRANQIKQVQKGYKKGKMQVIHPRSRWH